MGYRYPSGLEKTLCKWGVYVPLVTKWLTEDNVLEYTFMGPTSVVHITMGKLAEINP